MVTVSQHLIRTMTVFDVYDPDEMAADSSVSRRFPSSNNKHRYTLRNRAGSLERPSGLLTRLAMRHAGDLMLAYAADRFGTEIQIVEGGCDRFCLGTIVTGQVDIVTPAGRLERASPESGLMYRGEAGTRFLTSDGNVRLNVWVAAPRVEGMLQSLLGHPLDEKLDFEVAVDWSKGSIASLNRLIGYLSTELEREERLLSNPVALASFTDFLVQGMLFSLPHNYSDRLRRDQPPPAPRVIRRAEEYLREHAAEPLRVEAVAAAAGCSVRALQLAFRRFREMTPHAALQSIRLDAARRDLMRDDAPTQDIARRWGFTNAGRFSRAYSQKFGERPTDTAKR